MAASPEQFFCEKPLPEIRNNINATEISTDDFFIERKFELTEIKRLKVKKFRKPILVTL